MTFATIPSLADLGLDDGTGELRLPGAAPLSGAGFLNATAPVADAAAHGALRRQLRRRLMRFIENRGMGLGGVALAALALAACSSDNDGPLPSAGATEARLVKDQIAGAEAFLDADGDRIRDEGEKGDVSDADGRVKIDGRDGQIVTEGGIDTTTGAVMGRLMAPEGAEVVTPLTTLLVETGDAAELLKALGLPEGTNLATFDPLAALGGAEDALARDVLAQGHMVYATLAALQAIQDGVTDMAAADRALDLLGAEIETGDPIDLTDTALIGDLLAGAAGTDADTADIARLADALAAVNDRLASEMAADPLSSSARATALLAEYVLPEEIAALAGDTADASALDRLAARYGDGLDDLITRLADVLPDVADPDAQLVAGADLYVVARGESLVVEAGDDDHPLANDITLDAAGGTLKLVSVGVPESMAGELVVTLDPETGAITITPALDFHGTAAFTYVVEDAAGHQAEGLVLVDVPAWRATDGDDLLLGTDGAETIDGAAGADIILPGAGDDTVFGGAGADLIVGEAGADRLAGGSGADRIVAAHQAGEAVDLFGGSEADRFIIAPREADGALDLDVTIADFSRIEGDLIDLGDLRGADGALLTIEDVLGRAQTVDGNAVIDLDGLTVTGGGAVTGHLTLAGMDAGNLGAGDFVFDAAPVWRDDLDDALGTPAAA